MASNPNLENITKERVDRMTPDEFKKLCADLEAKARAYLRDDDGTATEDEKAWAREMLRTLGYDEHEEEKALRHVAMHMHARVETPGIRRTAHTQSLGFMTPQQAAQFLRSRGEL